jgi:hypothetical protein
MHAQRHQATHILLLLHLLGLPLARHALPLLQRFVDLGASLASLLLALDLVSTSFFGLLLAALFDAVLDGRHAHQLLLLRQWNFWDGVALFDHIGLVDVSIVLVIAQPCQGSVQRDAVHQTLAAPHVGEAHVQQLGQETLVHGHGHHLLAVPVIVHGGMCLYRGLLVQSVLFRLCCCIGSILANFRCDSRLRCNRRNRRSGFSC